MLCACRFAIYSMQYVFSKGQSGRVREFCESRKNIGVEVTQNFNFLVCNIFLKSRTLMNYKFIAGE